mgnify:FL=1
MTEDAVKEIQTALWAALVLVQMGVVGCLEVRAETVHREVTYEAVEDEAALPEEIMVSVLAGHDGEMVPCQAVGWVEEAAYWQDDFSFPITFYEYGAGAYQLGEITVKKTDLEEPEQLTELAEQYGTELLESMGLSAEEYEVKEIVWTGTPYEKEDGIMCRDAMAYGNRLLRDWRVQYEGFVEPERWQELKRGGVDGELNEEGQEETVPETIRAVTETLEKMPEAEGEEPKEQLLHGKSRLQEYLEKVTRIFLVAVGIGVVFFLGGLFVLALLWIGRKLREAKDRRK